MRRGRQKRGRSRSRSRPTTCWCCRNQRAGVESKVSGVVRLLCEDCTRLGEYEIEKEGRIQELMTTLTFDRLIPRKAARNVDRLKRHRISAVALLAEEMIEEDKFLRKISEARRNRDLEEQSKWIEQYDHWLAGTVDRLGAVLASRVR